MAPLSVDEKRHFCASSSPRSDKKGSKGQGRVPLSTYFFSPAGVGQKSIRADHAIPAGDMAAKVWVA